jgi:S-DNA-T family DNA segregation ATPase FtsK/SpoIIIE
MSAGLRAQFRRRLTELLALLAGLAGLTLLVALISYHPADPSFDTASAARALNLAGPAGAGIADILLQGFGIAGFLPGLLLLAWSYRLGARGVVGHLKLRVVLGGLAMPLLAAALAMAVAVIPGPVVRWPVPAGLGGAAGMILSQAVTGAGSSVLGRVGGGLAMVFTLLAALAAVLFALGFTPGEWRRRLRLPPAAAGGGRWRFPPG